MAVVKYGTIVTEIKGKMGGNVFQGGISGPTCGIKAHISKTSVALGKQDRSTARKLINQHGNLAMLAGYWRKMSDVDRAAWSTAAVGFPFKNKFGEMYTASGFQVYMSLNLNLMAIGVSMITVPPAPVVTVPTPAFTMVTGGSSDPFTFNTVVPSNYKVILLGTSQMSPGQNFVPSRLKAIQVFDHSFSGPSSVTDAYIDVFGSVRDNGNVWFATRAISTDTGQAAQTYNLKYSWS